MKIGIIVQFNDLTPSVLDVAPMVEAMGFESLWVGEHTHLPVDTVHMYRERRSRETGSADDAGVPDFYRRMADPYTTLAAAAACTTTIRLGTCIALPAEYNPLILAKEIATLDQISRGRFELGIGFGWNRPELENNGIDFGRRRQVLREKILAMQALWTNPSAGFEGEFVSFSDSWSLPKPAQRPHPPIRIGAAPSEQTLRFIVEFCDGWLPVVSHSGDVLPKAIEDLRSRWVQAGRDLAALTIDLVVVPSDMRAGHTVDEFRASWPTPKMVERYRSLGLHRLLVACPGESLATVEAALAALASSHVCAPG